MIYASNYIVSLTWQNDYEKNVGQCDLGEGERLDDCDYEIVKQCRQFPCTEINYNVP